MKTFLFRIDEDRLCFIDQNRGAEAKNEYLLTEDQVKHVVELMYEDGPEEHFSNMIVVAPARYCPDNLEKAKKYIRRVGRK